MAEQQVSVIGFVWRPEEITPSVIQMAQRTGSRAVFDFSMMGVDGLRSFLRKADPAGHVRDIKISVPALMDPSLGRLLKETGVHDIWVECHPWFFQGDPSVFLQRLRELSEDHCCFPIIGDLDLLEAILKDSTGIGRIVLKGCEASGFVSSETTLALYSMVREKLRTPSMPLDILIWGGVSTPEAAAALLSTGAAGIVFESVHWLTDLVAIDDVQRAADLQSPPGFYRSGRPGPAGSLSPFQQGKLPRVQGDQDARGLAARSEDHGRKPPFLRKPGARKGPPPPGEPVQPGRGHPSRRGDRLCPVVRRAFRGRNRGGREGLHGRDPKRLPPGGGEERIASWTALQPRRWVPDIPLSRGPCPGSRMSRSLPHGLPMPGDCPPSPLA